MSTRVVLSLVTGVSAALALGLGAGLANNAVPPVMGWQLGDKRVVREGTKPVSGPAIQLDGLGRLHLAWIEEEREDDRRLYYLGLHETSGEPAMPVQVNPADQPVAAVHQPPGLALGREGAIYLSWSSPHPQARGTPFTSLLHLSWSQDGGRTFAPPITVNDDAVVTNHSFDHLAVALDGTVHLAWIDAREGKKEPATFATRSTDQGRSVAKNVKVDEDTCVCCRTAVATAPDGTVYVAWRKVFEGHVRETVVARSTDGGRTFSESVIVGHDRWAFPACPHRPASIGVDGQGRLYVVWYTEGPDETPAIYLAVSDDGGRTFSPKRQLNSSKGTFPDHPQMAVDRKGRLVVVWEEQSPVRREVVLSYSLDRGQTFSPPQRLKERKGEGPAVAMNDQGLVALAWIEQVRPGRKLVVQFARLGRPEGVAERGR
ncbi:sialidase family protein [Nitrospira sp. Kam-Ns4a]